jgi:predicted nuclease of predicted toxin-antitoxin system
MPEQHRLYLDQMFRLDVAQALQKEGYNVVRASETGLARADDHQILQKAISGNRITNAVISKASYNMFVRHARSS